MDNRSAASILERVRREKEKRAAEGPPPQQQGQAAATGIPLAALAAGLLANGALTGATYGGIAGAGYGSAKKKTLTGAGRGIVRGGMTGLGATGGAMGGAGAGLLAGSALGVGGTPGQQAVTAGVGGLAGLLAGGVGGGVLGWKGADKLIGTDLDEKSASFTIGDPDAQAFSGAVQGMASGQLKSDALKDVASVGLGALGVGAAGRGLVGLIQMMRQGKKKTRSGPAYLPLPYPAKTAGFLDGDAAATKGGIPWYGPAMLGGGIAGLGLGWKGMDKMLDARRQREQKQELDQARQEFHDALLSQYDEPIKTHPSLMKKRGGDGSVMEKVGKALDTLFDKFEAAKEDTEKTAVDWSNLAGQATGGYGMYAGLSGLLTGAVVYDKMSKRSRRAVLEKALQQRQRRKFMQSPTEIMAVPEPMPVGAGA